MDLFIPLNSLWINFSKFPPLQFWRAFWTFYCTSGPGWHRIGMDCPAWWPRVDWGGIDSVGNSTLLGLFTHPNFINDESCTILVVGATARRAKGALFSNNTSPENVPNYQVRVGNLNLQAGQCKPGQCRPDKCKFKFSALTWAIGAFSREGFLAIKKRPPLTFLPIVHVLSVFLGWQQRVGKNKKM